MHAIRLESAGEPLQLREVATCDPAPEEAVVRVAGCGICHTDIGFWLEGVPTRAPLPLTLGHEISGTVEHAPTSHPELQGREVIVPAVFSCGTCDLCTSGRGNVCRKQRMPGNDIDGGFAERVVVPAAGLCPVESRPAGLELAKLSVVADAVSTPYQAVRRSGLAPGDVALVIGVGGVGTYCVQIAAALGARVIALDVDAPKLERIGGYGADKTFDPSALEFKELKRAVRSAARELGGAPHGWKIFECSGSPAGQQTAFGLLTHAATLVVVGFSMEKLPIRLSNLMAFDAEAIGSWGCPVELYPDALAMVLDGRIDVEPFVETHPMSRGPEVARRVADHEVAGRAVLIPDWDR